VKPSTCSHRPRLTLTAALRQLAWSNRPLAIVDGTLVPIDRLGGSNNRLYFSGKHHKHGVNLQALIDAAGHLLWISDGLSGSVHDLTVAREHALGALYAAARGLPTLADPGYEGAGHGVHTPIKQPAGGHQLHVDNRTYNTLLRSLRCIGERGFALLTGRWRCLQHITAGPSRIGDIARAALVLTHFEHGYLT